jgi:DNA-binding GntR family transcriptional regulator
MRRLKRVPAAELAISELRKAILTGALPPGRRLKPEALAEEMGVSRMPVRQALSLLEREGLVKTDRWRGTIVTPLDSKLILSIYELRAILERAVAAGVAERPFDSQSIRSVIALGREAASTENVGGMLDLDVRFHTELYDQFGNAVLSEVMTGLWGHVRRAIRAAVFTAGYRTRIWDEHEGIIDAIDARDPEKAATLASQHIANASRVALRNLEALQNKEPHPVIDVDLNADRPSLP